MAQLSIVDPAWGRNDRLWPLLNEITATHQGDPPMDDYDLYDEDDFDAAEESSEGQCDNCSMAPGEVGPLGICCACSIGQGADTEDCRCGTEN